MPFISNREFKIWAYSVSHSFLLLRSPNNEEDEVKAMQEGYNIDIEFVGVVYMDLPVILRGIVLKELREDLPEKFSGYSDFIGYRVFEIQSDKTYFIVAANYLVGKNNWINEDRMLNPNLEYDEILTTSEIG